MSLVDLGARADEASALVVQPDGRIVVAGTSTKNGASDVAVARLLNPQGTPDPSFGLGTGTSLINLGANEDASDLVRQPDGNLIVAGTFAKSRQVDFAVVRLLGVDGTLDFSYGDGKGSSLTELGARDFGTGVALQPDGQIIVAGTSDEKGTDDFALARLLSPRGKLDPAFGEGSGLAFANLGKRERAAAMTLQRDGKIVIAGTSNQNGSDDFAVARRFNPRGTADVTFGAGSGAALLDLGGQDIAEDVLVQQDGKLVLVGSSTVAGNTNIAIVRFNADGTPDSTFGAAGGRVLIDLGGADEANAVAVQFDGKIVVAASSVRPAGSDMAVLRLAPDGSRDGSFAQDGVATIDFGGHDLAADVAIQPDGQIVVAGTSGAHGTDDFAVARLSGDPADEDDSGGGDEPEPDHDATGGAPDGAGNTKRPVRTSRTTSRPRCGGRSATIVGTAKRDTLRGTARADVIVALGGNDVITGAGGKDVICSGSGNDRIDGGAGIDRLDGGSGADTLRGGSGDDHLAGGSGTDVLRGQAGKDRLVGGGGARDDCDGGAGRDSSVSCERRKNM